MSWQRWDLYCILREVDREIQWIYLEPQILRLVEEFYNRTIESIQCGSGIIDDPIQIGAHVV